MYDLYSAVSTRLDGKRTLSKTGNGGLVFPGHGLPVGVRRASRWHVPIRPFRAASADYDETDDYLCGLLVGAIFAVAGGGVLLWKLWPRSSPKVMGASASS